MSKPEANIRTRVASDDLISVVMPAFNEARYVNAAIESILNQTHTHLELIVVDDGSTDETPAHLEAWKKRDDRVVVLHQNHAGIVEALNLGMRRARGDLVARMDANDLVPRERLSKQAAYLGTHPEVGVVGTWMASMNEEGQPTGQIWRTPALPGEVAWALHFSSAMVHASVMVRRKLVLDAGLYRGGEFTHLEDYDLWARLLKKTKLANLPEVLYFRRELAGGITHREKGTQTVGAREIVRRLVQELLERAVSDEELDLIGQLHRRSVVEVRPAKDLLLLMYRRFAERSDLTPEEAAEVSWDVCRKLLRFGKSAFTSDPFLALDILQTTWKVRPLRIPRRWLQAQRSVRNRLHIDASSRSR
jgi:hypothetical protein